MRTVKILSVVAGGILALIVAGLFGLWLWVNPNDYKGQIAAAVKQSTGRELRLEGDIKLSVFPWVALELGPASLGNPPGFGAEAFLAFTHAAVRVKLFPLLAKRLDLDRVDLDGLDLRLRRDAEGRGNWQGFGATQRSAAEAGAGVGAATGTGASTGAGATATATASDAGAVGSWPRLNGLRITNGRVSYRDTVGGMAGRVVVERFTLDIGALGGQEVTPVHIAFQASRGVPGESLTFSAQFDLTAAAQYRRLQLQAVSCSGLLGRPGEGPPVHWELSAPVVEADLTQQTMGAPAFAMNYANAHITGKLQAIRILDDLSMTGSVALAPLVLHELAPHVGIVLPKTRDPRALALLSASSEFSYGSTGVRFEPLRLQLDDTHLQGSLALAGEPRAVKFELTVDQIKLDRYLSVGDGGAGNGNAGNGNARTDTAGNGNAGTGSAGNGADGVAPAGPGPGPGPQNAAGASAQAAEASKLPDADGVLTIGSVRLSPLDFADVRVTVALKDDVVHLFPALAQIDGGTYSGNITVDARGATPALSLDEHVSGVDMTRLLAGTAYKGRLAGRGTVNLKATARGAAMDSILRTLNGHFDANLADGAVEGIDVAYQLGRAQALLHGGPEPPRSNPPQTRFDAFKVSAEITNGLAKTSDLTISSSALRVTGQGSANLVSRGLDLQMLASLFQSPGARVADIPFQITGTYLDPTVRPDAQALAKDRLKQKLQDVLKKNGLKGLFTK
jgi:AsmA protein